MERERCRWKFHEAKLKTPKEMNGGTKKKQSQLNTTEKHIGLGWTESKSYNSARPGIGVELEGFISSN